MTDTTRRRPIKVRGSQWARAIAASLARAHITPNQISLASIGFSLVAGAALAWAGATQWAGKPAHYALAGLMIELRLLCNLFDGMVAVEGGKGTPAGELYNEVPDRIADVVTLVGAGCAIASFWGVLLGFLAAMLAVMTAYVRALGSSLGLPADFSGPMAKPHRMHTLTIVAAIAAMLAPYGHDHVVMLIGLIAIALGTALTVALRVRRAHDALMRKERTQ